MDFITHVTTASQVPPDPSPLWQPVSAGVLVSPWSIIYRSFLRATALEQWVSGPKSDHTVHSPEFSSWEAKGQEGMSQGWIPGGSFSVPSLGLPNQIFAVQMLGSVGFPGQKSWSFGDTEGILGWQPQADWWCRPGDGSSSCFFLKWTAAISWSQRYTPQNHHTSPSHWVGTMLIQWQDTVSDIARELDHYTSLTWLYLTTSSISHYGW